MCSGTQNGILLFAQKKNHITDPLETDPSIFFLDNTFLVLFFPIECTCSNLWILGCHYSQLQLLSTHGSDKCTNLQTCLFSSQLYSFLLENRSTDRQTSKTGFCDSFHYSRSKFSHPDTHRHTGSLSKINANHTIAVGNYIIMCGPCVFSKFAP